MSTPEFSGPGYFAGEPPNGLTTIAQVPVAATVRVYWRDPDDANAPDVLVASTESAANGTWQITDINPDLQYVIRGIKGGYNDVSINNCVPTRTDVITATGEFVPTEDFDGVAGEMLLVGGLPPYSVSVISPLPYGLTPVIDYRTLRIEGVSDDDGDWESVVRVTSSNDVTLDLTVSVVIDVPAWSPADLANSVPVWLDDEFLDEPEQPLAMWQNTAEGGDAFVQSETNRRPKIIAFGTRKAVRFDGTDDVMLSPERALFRDQSAGAYFVVYRRRSVTARYQRLISDVGGVENARAVVFAGHASSGESSPWFQSNHQDNVSTEINVYSGVAPKTDWIMCLYRRDWLDGISVLDVDGAQLVNTTHPWKSSVTDTDSYWPLAIGAHPNSAVQFADVDVAVILAIRGNLSADDSARLFGWAAHRYSLTDKLPADHPYKTVAP